MCITNMSTGDELPSPFAENQAVRTEAERMATQLVQRKIQLRLRIRELYSLFWETWERAKKVEGVNNEEVTLENFSPGSKSKLRLLQQFIKEAKTELLTCILPQREQVERDDIKTIKKEERDLAKERMTYILGD